MNRQFFTAWFCLSFSVLFLFSCNGGTAQKPEVDDQGFNYDINNFKIVDVDTAGTVLKSGHKNEITIEVESIEGHAAKDVPVTVVLLKEGVRDEAEGEQHYAGTYLLPEVEPGISRHKVEVNIPAIDSGYSEFDLMACFYEKLLEQQSSTSENLSDESDDSNISSDEELLVGDTVYVDPSLQNTADVIVSDVELSEDVLVLFPNSCALADQNTPLTMTMKLQSLAVDTTDAKLSVKLVHLDGTMNLPLKVRVNGVEYSEIDLPTLAKYQELQYACEIVVPTDVVQTLVTYVKDGVYEKYPFSVVASVNSISEGGDFLENNTGSGSFWLVPDKSLLPESTTGKRYGMSYYRAFGNSYFGAGFNFYTYLGVDQQRAYFDAASSLPISIMGLNKDLFKAEAYARAYFDGVSTDGKKPGIHVSVKLVDVVELMKPCPNPFNLFVVFSYDEEMDASWQTDGMNSGGDILNELLVTSNPNQVEVFKNNTIPNEASALTWVAEIEKEQFTMAGPIPVTIRGGLRGYCGAGIFAAVQPANIGGGFVPYAGLSAYVECSVGCSVLGFGAGGKLEVIQLQFKNFLWTNWEVKHDEDKVDYRMFCLNEYSGYTMDLLRGSLYVFVDYPWLKMKRIKVWKKHIWVPAGFETKRATKVLWQSDWIIHEGGDILPRKQYDLKIQIAI